MTCSLSTHLWLAAAVLTLGIAAAWLCWYLLDESPKDAAQRELDRKKR